MFVNLSDDDPDWGDQPLEQQDMDDAPGEQPADASASGDAAGIAPLTSDDVGGAVGSAPLLPSTIKEARVDDGWIHSAQYDEPIASGRYDRRVPDALNCKHTRLLRKIADFNIPDNGPKSDVKINVYDMGHGPMSRALVKLLRHDAANKPIPMDSGGWVPLHALSMHFGATHEYLACLVAACHIGGGNGAHPPGRLEPPRWLGRHDPCGFPKGYGLLSWGGWRYLGVRCAQGHEVKGLHEARLGVRFTPALAAKVPCIRHATYLAAAPSFLERGLLPGGASTQISATRCILLLSLLAMTVPSKAGKTEVSFIMRSTWWTLCL